MREGLRAGLLNGVGDVNVSANELTPLGGTGAIIFRATVQLDVFVKFHMTDYQHEEDGYNLLVNGSNSLNGRLIPPLPTASPRQYWIAPMADAVTLFQAIREWSDQSRGDPDPDRLAFLLDVYQDFLNTMVEMWHTTMSEGNGPNRDQVYMARTNRCIGELERRLEVSRLLTRDVEVNGHSFGPLQDVLREVRQRLRGCWPSSSCTTHGDEHAKNIMIEKGAFDYKPYGWRLVDYVNASAQSDWVLSIARMLNWWRCYFAIEAIKGNRTLERELRARIDTSRRGTIAVSYKPEELYRFVPDVCSKFDDLAIAAAKRAARIFDEEEQRWQERLKLAIFSIIFGSAYRHVDEAYFAVPILLGESLRVLREEPGVVLDKRL